MNVRTLNTGTCPVVAQNQVVQEVNVRGRADHRALAHERILISQYAGGRIQEFSGPPLVAAYTRFW